ncbi:MAG: 6-phosphofructokinase, partial [Dehalococcoidia bacterium]
MKRLGILTSGGDGPGMNACIRAAVRTAAREGVEMVGYADGFSGFVRGEHSPLDVRAVGNIIQRGGTFIGTSRCPEFMDQGIRAEAVRKMREDGVEG